MRIRLFKVTGESMLPELGPGSFVIVFGRRSLALRVGDVIVAEHPAYGRIVKRITAIQPDAALMLAGDNPAKSTSTQAMGAVPRSRVLGKVIWRIPSAGHAKDASARPVARQGNLTDG
ncbi:nickel-type superoxide dismutase maturation protease [Marinobacter bohaiensis]|uniref:nickel-type superoxide dismutase maturation protease n=1 Tax=Marinobacter bohaiensis TaxID=2201898 RepID=UPI000DACBF7C|nr:nickel-type superoxide dismutase maturation protease [Marinobacter bohaiensis]